MEYTREINLYDLATDAINPPTEKISCFNLKRFATRLLKIKEITGLIAVTGVNISRGENHELGCVKSSNGELDEIYENILDQMSCKRLKIKFHGWYYEPNCQTVLFAKKLLDKFSDSLEELSLWISDEPEFLLQHRSYQQLKLLNYECPPGYMPGNIWIPTIRMIVSRAPSLQKLFTSGPIDLSGNFLEGSSAVHFTDHPYSTSRGEIPESVVHSLRLHRMELTRIDMDFQMERFNRITVDVLEASRTTLNWMYMDVTFLVPLASYGICLENVTTLRIHLDTYDIKRFRNVLKRAATFDFNEIFPNLNGVTVEHYRNPNGRLADFLEILEQEDLVLREPTPANRAQNIKNLSLRWDPSTCYKLYKRYVEFLAKMFPDITSLSIRAAEIPFASIWKCWPHLEELNVTLGEASGFWRNNFDADFCGICEDEASELREQDEEYLRIVNPVPVKPSITTMTSLRTLKICLRSDWEHQIAGPVCFLSKVTGWIAFQRCPNLIVDLEVDSEIVEQAMSDIEPFVNLSFVRRP